MPLRVKFAFDFTDTSVCERKMNVALMNVLKHYKYKELPPLAHRILKEVDKVLLSDMWISFETIDGGEMLMIDDLSNTCKSLLCLTLDKEGVFKYKASFIGWNYHYFLTEISKVSNALLYVDIPLQEHLPKNNMIGVDLNCLYHEGYQKYFGSYMGYHRQYRYEEYIWYYETDTELWEAQKDEDMEIDDYRVWIGYRQPGDIN